MRKCKEHYSKIIQSLLIVASDHILGLILRNVDCAQVVLQIYLNLTFISVSLEQYVCKYVRFKLYLEWNKCILNKFIFTRECILIQE